MAGVRGAHLNELLRQTPFAAAANVAGAALLLWAFREAVPIGLWIWSGVLMVVIGLAMWGWFKRFHGHGGKVARTSASPRAVHRSTWHAVVLASTWAYVPTVVFPSASGEQQFLVGTLVTGMLGAGTFLLSALPLASIAYATIFSVASFFGLWMAHKPMYLGVIGLLVFYSPMVVIGALFAWRKSTALIQSRSEAVRQERVVTVLLQDFELHADEALWETDLRGELSHLSARLAQLLDMSDVGSTDTNLVGILARANPQAAEVLERALHSGRAFRDVTLSIPHGGAQRHLVIHGNRFADGDGKTLGWRGVLADVTDKVESQKRLHQLAHTDALTGLANRVTLLDRLSESLTEGARGALLTVDIDHFKTINDSLGHKVGDDLLRAVSERFMACVRGSDLVARLGGDEFAIWTHHRRQDGEGEALARRVLESLAEPFMLHGQVLHVRASVGVAVCTGQRIPVEDFMVQSDTALYAAKNAGRGQYAVYSYEMGERSRRRTVIEEGLSRALQNSELDLHWQPKVNIASWAIDGAEALMRWTHPVLGSVSPAEFIPVAEQCGLIPALGNWALRNACQALCGPLAGLTVAVNVSPLQLKDKQFSSHVSELIWEFKLNPAQLELEITESVFLDDPQGALEQLHALRRLGVRVALDDFGTGYSSLAYLRQFPFDTLKIDRSFVMELLVKKDAEAIVQMIVQLANTLDMRTVSEGVETPEQLEAVARAGCHDVQGYLVSAPISLTAFLHMRHTWSPARSARSNWQMLADQPVEGNLPH